MEHLGPETAATSISTLILLGPIGIFCLVLLLSAWFLWLRYGQKSRLALHEENAGRLDHITSILGRLAGAELEQKDTVKSLTSLAKDVAIQTTQLGAHLEQDRMRFEQNEKEFATVIGRFEMMEHLLAQPRVDELARARLDDLVKRVDMQRVELDAIHVRIAGR